MEKTNETKNLILEKSREIFLNKSLFNSTMSDIAERAGLSRRTIYRYFDTKEELAYEITIELLNEWNSYQKEIFTNLRGTGIERLEIFLNKLIDYMSEKADVMRYLSEFDFYFQDKTTHAANEMSKNRFNKIILKSDELLEEIMILGKKDKSIKKDIDIKLIVATISNVLWSFGQRIAIRGESIKKEYNLDGISLIKKQVDIYIAAIKEE